ncbi:MAG: glycosyl transferase, family 2 [Devosia sp.]|nr:glycosyl transferase, family 2 [Devosia sp.]
MSDVRYDLPLPRATHLAPGLYALSVAVPSGAGMLRHPLVEIVSATPEHRISTFHLGFDPERPNMLAAELTLPEGASKLEFQPGGNAMPRLGAVRIRRISSYEYRGQRLASGLTRLLRRPDQLLGLVPRAIGLLRTGGPRALYADLTRGGTAGASQGDYQRWIATIERLTPAALADIAASVAALHNPPLISVVMPVYNPPIALLESAIASVAGQLYPHWELCLADDGSRPETAVALRQLAASDPRIKLTQLPSNGGISAATNAAFTLATGEFIALLDHDDTLAPHALAEVALTLAEHPDAELIYSDEDKLSLSGRRYDPFFKPEFSRELFRSQNYLNHLTVLRTATVHRLGGWQPAFDGSQDYDLNLRVIETAAPGSIVHIPKILYHWRAAMGSVARGEREKTGPFDAGLRALTAHLQRTGFAGSVERAAETAYYRIRPAVKRLPLVSIIIPTRDQEGILRRCIDSITEKSTYGNFEILVIDNGSNEPAALAYLAELATRSNVRVLAYGLPFNFSAINNFAAADARGDVLVLCNNDIEVITPGWLEELVGWAMQPDIGCVGAKLYYADGTIQHAGVVLGIGGVAGHSHKYFPRSHRGYFSRLKLVQNLSAVTAACLAVRRDVFEAVGGFDAEHLSVAFNDVDFCLRVAEAGYRTVWTPFAELYHLESVSRGAEDDPQKLQRFHAEIGYMQSRWTLTNDPYYSPHLTLEREDFSLALQPRPAITKSQ